MPRLSFLVCLVCYAPPVGHQNATLAVRGSIMLLLFHEPNMMAVANNMFVELSSDQGLLDC